MFTRVVVKLSSGAPVQPYAYGFELCFPSYSLTHLIVRHNGRFRATFTSCVRPEHVMVLTHSILEKRGQRSDKRRKARCDEKGR